MLTARRDGYSSLIKFASYKKEIERKRKREKVGKPRRIYREQIIGARAAVGFRCHKSSGGWKIGGVRAYPRERTANGRLVPIRERCNRLNGSVRRPGRAAVSLERQTERERERENVVPGFERGAARFEKNFVVPEHEIYPGHRSR